MKTRKNFVILITIAAVCLIITWLTGPLQGRSRNEIQPEISVPMQQTDAARAIDAYERVMDRYMDISERSMTALRADIADTNRKLDLIIIKIENIERALKIEPSKDPAGKTCPPPPAPALNRDTKPQEMPAIEHKL